MMAARTMLIAASCLVSACSAPVESNDLGAIEGIVRDQDGAPDPRAMVSAEALDDAGRKAITAQTDADGRYSLRVKPGRYVAATILRSGGACLSEPMRGTRIIDVQSGQVVRLDLPLRAFTGQEGQVIGRVTDAKGAPLAGALVTACGQHQPTIKARTNAAGEYSLTLGPGTWTITVIEVDGVIWLGHGSSRINLGANESRRVDIRRNYEPRR